jgi:hypothetical protein
MLVLLINICIKFIQRIKKNSNLNLSMKLKTYKIVQLNYVLHIWNLTSSKNYIIQLFKLKFWNWNMPPSLYVWWVFKGIRVLWSKVKPRLVSLREIVSIRTTLSCNWNSEKSHIQLLCNYPLGITNIVQLSP